MAKITSGGPSVEGQAPVNQEPASQEPTDKAPVVPVRPRRKKAGK